ncbi:MAG: CPBP family intramembrane metalloprotease [Prevotella sp.]|nr:CPBP family intramembrane metalloprotease [Prevotella sp.]
MENKNVWTSVLYVILFVSVFFLLQALAELLGAACYAIATGGSFSAALGSGSGELTAITIVVGSLLSIALFVRMGWAPVSRNYLKSRPWAVIVWTMLLGLGCILPMEFIGEKLQLMMPDELQQLFEVVMKTPWGYIALGIMAPVTEELIFRGAVLRTLLGVLGGNRHWVAIAISALVFGLVHLNLAQGAHAFLAGLMLGWLYYRSGSIIPGIIVHWVNNTVAYVMFNLMPEMNDGKLIDLFHGNERMMYGGLFFSLCIFVPALYQLAVRLRRA